MHGIPELAKICWSYVLVDVWRTCLGILHWCVMISSGDSCRVDVRADEEILKSETWDETAIVKENGNARGTKRGRETDTVIEVDLHTTETDVCVIYRYKQARLSYGSCCSGWHLLVKNWSSLLQQSKATTANQAFKKQRIALSLANCYN